MSSELSQPFSIGGLSIPNRVVLAPMAGITNSAYRRHLKRHGVGLVVTEMVSAYGLIYANRRTEEYLDFAEEERPVAVQLFGDEPEVMGRAARLVLEREPRPDLIDLNLGCPVRKVTRGGAGCALGADAVRAAAVTAAVVGAASPRGVPVTAKIRSGLTPEQPNAVELARRLEDAGVAAVAVPPRAATQFYRGRADHELTARVVEALSVPVIASGDVYSWEIARTILAECGADAVMAARGALGNPWLIGELLEGRTFERPSLAVAVRDLLELLELARGQFGPERATRWLRKHLTWYLQPYPVPGTVVHELRKCPDDKALVEALESLPGTYGSQAV